MHIHHLAIWCRDLEKLRKFYVHSFGMKCSSMYSNEKKQYSSYFLSFEGQRTSIELMHRPDITEARNDPGSTFGLAHLSISVGSRKRVDTLTRELRAAGHPIIGEPRTTGDGYYESVVADPEGNLLEITE